MRREDEFTRGDGTSKMGNPRRKVINNEMGRRIYHRKDGKWQVMRWEDEFTPGDGMSKMGSYR